MAVADLRGSECGTTCSQRACILYPSNQTTSYWHHNVVALNNVKQECIPVGCVPPEAVAICWGGSASVHTGIHLLGVGLETPPARPQPRPGCGSEDHPWPDPSTSLPGFGPETSPLGVGLEISPNQTPQHPPWVWAWRPSPPPLWTDWLTDRCKNITFANFVCGGNKNKWSFFHQEDHLISHIVEGVCSELVYVDPLLLRLPIGALTLIWGTTIQFCQIFWQIGA